MFEVIAFYRSGIFARRVVVSTFAAAESFAAIYRQDGFVARVARVVA
jgi:hypothetical protein